MNIVTDLANWLRSVLGIDVSVGSMQISKSIRYWIIGRYSLVRVGYEKDKSGI